MAFFQCNIFSESLGIMTNVNVVMPQFTTGQIGWNEEDTGSRPVLYLLHGLSDDSTVWMRRTSVERYATQYGLALVMPDGGRSFYTDMKCGLAYEKYIALELPELMGRFFRFSQKAEDTFIAGNSMGGYGAMKIALKYPEKFCAAAALSAVPDPMKLYSLIPAISGELENIFGSIDEFRNSDNDLYSLAEKRSRDNRFPKLFMTCGTGDFLSKENHRFCAFLDSLNVEYTFDEEAGNHEWGYWDRKIQQVIRFLPIRKSHI